MQAIMISKFRKAFLRRAGAGAVVLAVAGIAPARAEIDNDPPINIGALIPTGKVCMSPREIAHPQNPVQIYMARIFNIAGIDENMPKMGDSDFELCLDSEMNILNSCRGFDNGYYLFNNDKLYINPGSETTDQTRVTTTRHELRHRYQNAKGVTPFVDGPNVPESERVILMWAIEADGRLENVLVADKLRAEGHPEYVANLIKNEYKPLMQAYDHALRDHPEDRVSAMRAVIYAFLQLSDRMDTYANGIAAYIETTHRFFDYTKPRDTILADEAFRILGERDGIGNYMNEDLKETLIHSYSQREYLQLVEKRAKAAGTPGVVCTKPAPKPVMPPPGPAGAGT